MEGRESSFIHYGNNYSRGLKTRLKEGSNLRSFSSLKGLLDAEVWLYMSNLECGCNVSCLIWKLK